MPRRRGPGRYVSRSPTSSSSTGATYLYGGLLLLLALSASLQLRNFGPADEKSSASGSDSANTATKAATAPSSDEAPKNNKCKRKRARNDYSPSGSERQETLIHLLGREFFVFLRRW